MIEFLLTHNLTGIAIGLCTFLIIGLFHPLIIKGEYYFGVKCWWAFLIMGIVGIVAAIMVKNLFLSAILGVTAFSSLWGIKEICEQRERVKKGWFPSNPKHFSDLNITQSLYESAFPPAERRSFEELQRIATAKSAFRTAIYKKEHNLLGFIFYWKFMPSHLPIFSSSHFRPFLYIEHFAVAEQLRNQGFGRKLLQDFCSKTKLPIILEVEKPDNEIAQRRIGFYENLGFQVSDFPYIQPAYSPEKQPVPMLLMYRGNVEVDVAVEVLKKEVYEIKLRRFSHLGFCRENE
jgi:ribosomal protein S18 acetylase RimI-like enzyme/branched-subunit amino acid transport protein